MPDPVVTEARTRAAGHWTFHIHVGRDGDRWVAQCQEVDVWVTMPTEPLMRWAMHAALEATLQYGINRQRLAYITTTTRSQQ